MQEDDLVLRPGRIRHRPGGRKNSFVGQVKQAAKRAGQTGRGFGRRRGSGASSSFGRGRAASVARSLASPHRRVVIKARVVRHVGARFRSAPMSRHITYLKREGVTRDGARAEMFNAGGDAADGKAFAERIEDDRHHFRFIVSPEDAAELEDLKSFTRDLMKDAERDLGTRLDWVAVDHWNTDNPHVHVLVRGRADDGQDLVISRDYISRGFRARAEGIVSLELGPRSEREIGLALQREVAAERWTGLDRALQAMADEGGGVADLRPNAEGPDDRLRRLFVGRAMTLERLNLAEPVGPGVWTIKPNLEGALRELGIRGDIIKTMHQAMTANDAAAPDVSRFAIHSDHPTDTVVGRLVERGHYDELSGVAYAVVDGADGRTHHLKFGSLDMTGDAPPGAIVELRSWEDPKGKLQRSLAIRSDLSLEAQVVANGATWIDRQLVAKEPVATAGGFGLEIRDALARRTEYLLDQGLAERRGGRVGFQKGLIDTLRSRDLEAAAARIAQNTGLKHSPSETIAGIYSERVTLASGRFAMIDNGLGFQLVPWRPALEQKLGQHVSGAQLPGGGVDWSIGRQRGPSV